MLGKGIAITLVILVPILTPSPHWHSLRRARITKFVFLAVSWSFPSLTRPGFKVRSSNYALNVLPVLSSAIARRLTRPLPNHRAPVVRLTAPPNLVTTKSYEDWECGWLTDFFCVPWERNEASHRPRHQEFMGWISEKSFVDLELDEKPREEVSSLILLFTSFG